jgi:2-methylcitrate dehydratase PrpD
MAPDRKLLPDLAAFIAALRARDFDAATLDTVKLHGFDALGSACAGAATSEIGITRHALLRAAFLTPPKSILDHPGCAAAILVTACRLTECDDIHIDTCTTPSSVVFPVALVAGYVTKASQDAILEGIIAGYQTMITLGLAANGAEIIYRGIWPTFLTGGITAAAIAGKVMGLSERQIRDAMAIAASGATGVTGRIEEEPAPRWLVLASAVQSGLLATAAAERGMHGDEAILGKVSPVWNPETLKLPEEAGPGAPLHLHRIGFKPYCTSRQGLSATEAFIQAMREEKIEPHAIDKITVAVPQHYRAMIDRTNRPKTKSESRSIHYQLALGALYPDELCDIERATLRAEEPAVRHILDRVEVIASERLTKLYPKQWGGAVKIDVGAKSHEREVLNPRGDPENPLGWDAIASKLHTMSRYVSRPIPVSELTQPVKALDFSACLDTLLERIKA